MKKHKYRNSGRNSGCEKTINLALQGGGAHGAFAWGVLDRLLEDGRVGIDGICATSAGTMNACTLAIGMHRDGAEGARQALHDFWYRVSRSGHQYDYYMNPALSERPQWWGAASSFAFFVMDSVTRVFSPHQLNPFDINPLREIVKDTVNFDVLRECDCVKLFISTTHVRSGKVRVFNTEEITLDVVMASACLPFVFRAVEIEGEPYWDGGYTGNPSLFPLFYNTDSNDVLVVHINPIERYETPKTAMEIMNRVNEISFNSSLLKEMRAIAFVKRLVEEDTLKKKYKDKYRDVLIHSLRADEALRDLSLASKFNSGWQFLTMLRDRGREAMSEWLDKHYDSIGVEDTVDLYEEFLD